jgi:hypothetical protein
VHDQTPKGLTLYKESGHQLAVVVVHYGDVGIVQCPLLFIVMLFGCSLGKAKSSWLVQCSVLAVSMFCSLAKASIQVQLGRSISRWLLAQIASSAFSTKRARSALFVENADEAI